MKKPITITIIVVVVLVILFYILNSFIYNQKQGNRNTVVGPTVEPIAHATAVLEWGDGTIIYLDPTGGAEAFKDQQPPHIILVTDIHGDHLSTTTLSAVASTSTIIVPQAVFDLLPESLKTQSIVLKNSEAISEQGFIITAVPMYNLPEASDSRHIKGRGNGYVVEKEGYRVYVAGDTSATPEMKALVNIDMAFVPMNPPYTMTVQEAAEGVLAFAPKVVYPFHYRSPDGLNDVDEFKDLVEDGNDAIEVILLDWYK